MRNNITKLRKTKGLSMDDLARMIECNKTQIFRLEKGQDITASWMIRLCKALDCFITDILPDLQEFIPPQNKTSIELDTEILVEVNDIVESVLEQKNIHLESTKKIEIIAKLYELAYHKKITGDTAIDNTLVSWLLKNNLIK